VLGVLTVGLLGAHTQQLHRPQREPAPLEPGHDLADEPARERVGLDHHERPLDVGHRSSCRARDPGG
jgi:hypothetical protein